MKPDDEDEKNLRLGLTPAGLICLGGIFMLSSALGFSWILKAVMAIMRWLSGHQ